MIGVVTGLRAEALLVPQDCRVACSGGDSPRAHQLAKHLLDQGVEGLLSFGLAGGLVHGLAPGELVVASGVVVAGELLQADVAWQRALHNSLPGARTGIVAGASAVAATVPAKRLLQLRSHAIAVDLESGAVAEACVKAGKPFAVLRAIADPAERGVPQPALLGLDAEGRVRVGAVLWGLLRDPGELAGIIRLGFDSRAGLRALAGAAGSLGATFRFEPA